MAQRPTALHSADGYRTYHGVANSNAASMLGDRLFKPHAYPADGKRAFEGKLLSVVTLEPHRIDEATG